MPQIQEKFGPAGDQGPTVRSDIFNAFQRDVKVSAVISPFIDNVG